MNINLANIDFCPGGGKSATLTETTAEILLTETEKVIVPPEGTDGFNKVTITHAPVEESVSATITENGTHTITPSAGFDAMFGVSVDVNVPKDPIPGTKDWFNSDKFQHATDYTEYNYKRFFGGTRTGNSYSEPGNGLAYKTYNPETQVWSDVVDRDGNIIRCDFLQYHNSGVTGDSYSPTINMYKNFINEEYLAFIDNATYNVTREIYYNGGVELTQSGQYMDEIELDAFEILDQYSHYLSDAEKKLVKGKPVLFNGLNLMPFSKECGSDIDWPIQDVVFDPGLPTGFFSIDSPAFSMEARGQNINFPEVLNPSTTIMNSVRITSEINDYGGSSLLSYITEIKEISNDPKYTCFCFSSLQNLKKIPAKVFNNATYTYGMFALCGALESIPEGTKFPAVTKIGHSDTYRGMFYHCDNLKSIPLDMFDGAVISDAENAFNGCSSLVSVGKITLNSENNYVDNMFLGCSSLENLGGLTNLKNNLSLKSCSLLTHDSLMNVINEAADVTSSPKTLTLGADNLNKLTDEEKAIATNKGWVLA